MSRWFRFYDCALDDPKVQRLPGDLFKAWVNLLCVASRNDGKLPGADDLAFSLRMSVEAIEDALTSLRAVGLIDWHGPGDFAPHNWNERQFKSDADPTALDRKRRQRDKLHDVTRDGHGDVTRDGHGDVTRTEQNRVQNRTEQKEARERAVSFTSWYEKYPHKVGRATAEKAFGKALEKGVSLDELDAGLAAYIRTKPPDHPWCNPATWLNGERWKDQPAGSGSPTALAVEAVPKTGDRAFGKIYAHREAPQFEAWRDYEIGLGRPPPATDRHGGWWFAHEWPPTGKLEAAE
jgi:hypothetical protein